MVMTGSWVDVLFAVPVVGIAFLALLPSLLAGLGAAGSIAGSRAQGRQAQAQANAQQDALLSNQYATRQNALLDAGKLALQAPGYRMQNMVRGSMLANAQPMQISHPRATIPQMSGGFNPNQLLSPAARQMGSVVQRQSLLDQMRGDDPSKYLLQAPGVTPQPRSSWLDSLLGAAGMIGGIGGGAYIGGQNIKNILGGGQPPTSPWQPGQGYGGE